MITSIHCNKNCFIRCLLSSTVVFDSSSVLASQSTSNAASAGNCGSGVSGVEGRGVSGSSDEESDMKSLFKDPRRL